MQQYIIFVFSIVFYAISSASILQGSVAPLAVPHRYNPLAALQRAVAAHSLLAAGIAKYKAPQDYSHSEDDAYDDDYGPPLRMPTPEENAFWDAAATGKCREISRFLARGMPVDTIDQTRDGYTALLKAADAGHNRVVLILLNAGATINFTSSNNNLPEDGNTALILAAYKGHHDVVETLIKKGASLLPETASGYSALAFATYQHRAHPDEEARKKTFLLLADAIQKKETEDDDMPPLSNDLD
jgi:hypothetical protein